MPGKEFEEIKKLSPETLLKIDTWLNTWPVGGVSSLGIAMRFNMPEYEEFRELIKKAKEAIAAKPDKEDKTEATVFLFGKPCTLLELSREILTLAGHGDYSNGNEAYGVDEGRVRAGELLESYKQKLIEFGKMAGKPVRYCPFCEDYDKSQVEMKLGEPCPKCGHRCTCDSCKDEHNQPIECEFRDDPYNTDGDCLATK